MVLVECSDPRRDESRSRAESRSDSLCMMEVGEAVGRSDEGADGGASIPNRDRESDKPPEGDVDGGIIVEESS